MQAGGFGYEVPAGRRDGRISLVNETFTNLPPPTLNVDQLTQAYAKKGSHKKKWSLLKWAVCGLNYQAQLFF